MKLLVTWQWAYRGIWNFISLNIYQIDPSGISTSPEYYVTVILRLLLNQYISTSNG